VKLLTSQLTKSNIEKSRMAAEIKTLKEDLQKCMDSKLDKPRPRGRSPPIRSQSMFYTVVQKKRANFVGL